MIAVVDYGAGNLTSVLKGLRTAGADCVIARTPGDLDRANAVVVPGVGNFAATAAIDATWRGALLGTAGHKPLLGICLGMQFLFDGSDEAPGLEGLSLVSGRCTRLPPTAKVPHVGWNTVAVTPRSRLLHGIDDEAWFYFTHSYAAPITDACIGRTAYTALFAAAVERGSVFGVQFHPEKSGDAGLRVLKNFVEAARC